jgi:hypothetical protein
LHEIEYLVFPNYNVFFGKKTFSRNSRFPVRSVFVINVSLFTSVVCYCQNGKGGKHGKCSLCNEWWHCWLDSLIKWKTETQIGKLRMISIQPIITSLPFIHNMTVLHHIPYQAITDQLSQIWRKTHWSIWEIGDIWYAKCHIIIYNYFITISIYYIAIIFFT